MKRRMPALGATVSVLALVAFSLGPTTAALAAAPVLTRPGSILQFATIGAQTPTFADSGFTFSYADTTRGVSANSDAASADNMEFTIVPPVGQPLVAGMYLYNGDETPIVSLASAAPDATGRLLDVLDVASSPTDGTITRFDAVIQGIGEFRFGENESASPVVIGAHTMLFAESFVGYPAQLSLETLHNTGAQAVSVGTATTVGHARGSYKVSHSTCGAVLAAGAECTFSVGFSPTTGGPADAQLSIPVAGGTQFVNLSGSAFLGTSSITVTGKDPVDKGKTTTAVAGKVNMIETSGTYYGFTASDPVSGNEIADVALEAPNYAPVPVGSRATGFLLNKAGYAVRATVDSLGCDTTGSEDVKAFRVDSAAVATMADVTFSQHCFSNPNLQTGTLLWQYRADVTAPNAPTSLKIAGSTASWKASTSTDSSTVIVRLVQGNGTGATPESGAPLTTSGNSAALPVLPEAEQYSVVLFDVDKAGNVSKATTATLGSAPKVVTAPSQATSVTAVAGPDGTATVTFVAPKNKGGLPITDYVVQSLAGAGPSVTTTATTVTVTGLRAGGLYQFIVFAYNAAGRGEQSLTSGTVAAT